jgi:hypothetical protein
MSRTGVRQPRSGMERVPSVSDVQGSRRRVERQRGTSRVHPGANRVGPATGRADWRQYGIVSANGFAVHPAEAVPHAAVQVVSVAGTRLGRSTTPFDCASASCLSRAIGRLGNRSRRPAAAGTRSSTRRPATWGRETQSPSSAAASWPRSAARRRRSSAGRAGGRPTPPRGPMRRRSGPVAERPIHPRVYRLLRHRPHAGPGGGARRPAAGDGRGADGTGCRDDGTKGKSPAGICAEDEPE